RAFQVPVTGGDQDAPATGLVCGGDGGLQRGMAVVRTGGLRFQFALFADRRVPLHFDQLAWLRTESRDRKIAWRECEWRGETALDILRSIPRVPRCGGEGGGAD